MKLARLDASLHRIPIEVPLLKQPRLVGVVVVRVESDDGSVGDGVAAPQGQAAVIAMLDREIAPFVVGHDPLLAEGLAQAAWQRFNARGMTGVVSSALSGLDLALWDLRGKVLGQPVWRLLGGCSRR